MIRPTVALVAGFMVVALFAAPAAAAQPTTFQPQFQLTDDAPTEAERLQRAGKRDITIGVVLGSVGTLGQLVTGVVDLAVGVGYSVAVPVILTVINATAIIVGAVMCVRGSLEHIGADRARREGKHAAWGFRWGPPVGPERPLPAPGLVAPRF